MRIDQIASSRYNGFSQENVEGRLSAQAYRSGAQWQVELYSYDADGYLVAKRVMTQDMQSRDATHTYNRNGDRQGRIHHRRISLVSGSAFGLWYDYDTHGRPWKVFASTSTTKPGTPEATYTYFASGQKKSEQYRGNLALPYSYTIRGRLETIGAPRDSAYPYPFSAHYVYTNGGNVRFADSFHRTAVPGGTVPQGYRYAYSYDGMDGLTSANYAAWTGGTSFAAASLRFSTRNISYDRSGNILRLYRYNENGTMADNLTYTYSGGTSRLAGVSDAAGAAQTWVSGTLTGFYHDSNGNLTYYYDASRGHHYDMWYDEENRVSMYAEEHVTTGLYKETRYRYNAAGQRYWKKTDNANPEYYVMDGALTLGVIAPSGAVEWNIATASGEIVGRRTSGGQFRYYIKDHLGSVRAVVSSSGTVLETRDYYPYGLEMPGRSYLSGTKAKENYTGHERDAETGMLYAGARFYMPNIGRWTSVDPLAASYAAWSPYNYVLNNPLGFVDPDGRCPVSGGWNHGGGSCIERLNPVREAWRQGEALWNSIFTRPAENARQKVDQTVETIVKDGPEVLDNVTLAASGTAVVAGTVALASPEPASKTAASTVATGAAFTATVANLAATGLSITDALFFGGSHEEATLRSALTLINFSGGRLLIKAMSRYTAETGAVLTPAQQAGLRNAANTAGGTVATGVVQEAIKR